MYEAIWKLRKRRELDAAGVRVFEWLCEQVDANPDAWYSIKTPLEDFAALTGFILTDRSIRAITRHLCAQTMEISNGQAQASIPLFQGIEYDAEEIRFVLEPYAARIRAIEKVSSRAP